MMNKIEYNIEKTKTIFLIQKAVKLIMKCGKQDKALNLMNECLTIANQMQKNKKINSHLAQLKINKKENFGKYGFPFLSTKMPTLSPLLSFQGSKLNENNNSNTAKKVLNTSEMIERAINNVSPFLEVRKVRTSRNSKQVPSMIQKNRQETLAIRWIIEAAQQRQKKSSQNFSKCLAIEFLEAYSKRGIARQKRNEMHKVAYVNRAHLRSRWW